MYRVQGGGPAATGAVTVSILGGDAELWAVHGEDANGSYLASELEEFGVGIKGVIQPEGAVTLVSGILTAPDGERHIFCFHGSGLWIRKGNQASIKSLPLALSSLTTLIQR